MTTPGPWASIRPARDAARNHARLGQDTGARGGGGASTGRDAADSDELGPWRLMVTDNGDLAAMHTNGTVHVLATAHPEEETE